MSGGRPPSRPHGHCLNPKCGHPTRTSGPHTPETKGMRRHVKNVCAPCAVKGYTPVPEDMPDTLLFQDFEWSPELLTDAVNYAMENMLDVAA
ncbi:hypothetical protein SEA_LYMARA_91 [Arthrobacter phage Lymara]|uniref:Uncharacterized protein n=1 Tax=Arthrobacter phage Lymara TaxID=2599828 RepID=A0A5J6U2D1_9CAUD|nr:hypothetical protein HYQ01_gp091 [Arthrobacter phage Lymara]QFG14892.1 hypothetical protein SEA_LYMARA_91 [Arthrobacter phage Lymara]